MTGKKLIGCQNPKIVYNKQYSNPLVQKKHRRYKTIIDQTSHKILITEDHILKKTK